MERISSAELRDLFMIQPLILEKPSQFGQHVFLKKIASFPLSFRNQLQVITCNYEKEIPPKNKNIFQG